MIQKVEMMSMESTTIANNYHGREGTREGEIMDHCARKHAIDVVLCSYGSVS